MTQDASPVRQVRIGSHFVVQARLSCSCAVNACLSDRTSANGRARRALNKRGPLPRPCHATIAMLLRFAPCPCACEASLRWRPRPACAQPVKARGRLARHLAVATRAACGGAQPPDTLGPVALAQVGGSAGESLAHPRVSPRPCPEATAPAAWGTGPRAGAAHLPDTRSTSAQPGAPSRCGRHRALAPIPAHIERWAR